MNRNIMQKALSLLLVLLMILPITNSYAKEQKTTIVYGAALSAKEQQETREFFSSKDAKEDVIYAKDYERYIKGSNTSDSNLVSSVQVTTGMSDGINVNIVTKDNITKVTEGQYENAVLTAGLGDSNIEVAAIRPVTGESALAGIYKVAEINGINLSEDNMKLAQEELSLLTEVSNDNKDEKDFDDNTFQEAITNIKIEIVNLVEDKGGSENISDQDIRDIVINIFNEFNINISQSDIDKISNFMISFKNNVKKEDIKEFLNQAEKIVGDFVKEAKASGFWDKIVQFFQQIWQAIMELFNKASSK